jgi:DNA-binding response OmpR family regulator
MAVARPVLIVNGPGTDRTRLAEILGAEGSFDPAVCPAADPSEVAAMARSRRYGAVILNVLRPGTLVGEMLAAMRAACPCASVIVLAAAAEEAETVTALNGGAADFMVAPIRAAELKARLRAQLRSQETTEDAELTIGPFRFRPSARILHDTTRNSRIRLTYKETQILRYLYSVGDRPVPRMTLLRDVWGYNNNVKSFTVESHIYRLRQKLERDPAGSRLLVNVKGGYRLQTDLPAHPGTHVVHVGQRQHMA